MSIARSIWRSCGRSSSANEWAFREVIESGHVVLVCYCGRKTNGRSCHRYLLKDVLIKVAKKWGYEVEDRGELLNYHESAGELRQEVGERARSARNDGVGLFLRRLKISIRWEVERDVQLSVLLHRASPVERKCPTCRTASSGLCCELVLTRVGHDYCVRCDTPQQPLADPVPTSPVAGSPCVQVAVEVEEIA